MDAFIKFIGDPTERGCRLWLGGRDKDGYGLFTLGKKTVRAHRFAFELSTGQKAGPLLVMHSCDTPSCVEPSHLSLGTHRDNMLDRNAKGRQAVGESFPVGPRRRAVTADLVREIRSSTERECDLVRRLGVAQPTVNHILTRRTWRHLE